MMCLAPGDCSDKRELWESNLANVGSALAATYGEIRREFPWVPVLVTAYPAPIYTEQGAPVSCGAVALSRKDMEFIGDFVTELNDTVERAAASMRFHFLGEMEHALADAHLQLCDKQNDERPGINFIGLRSVGGIAEQRFNPANWYHNSLHPNERGHAAMLQVFEQWRTTHPDPARDAPGRATAAPPGERCPEAALRPGGRRREHHRAVRGRGRGRREASWPTRSSGTGGACRSPSRYLPRGCSPWRCSAGGSRGGVIPLRRVARLRHVSGPSPAHGA